jgi:mannose-6-phosphate isomerase
MGSSRRELLVATRYFALERLTREREEAIRLKETLSPRVLTCIEGELALRSGGWNSSLTRGETLVLPVAAAATLTASRHSVLMHGWVPDLEREIIAPARAAGADDAALSQLGIHLGVTKPDGEPRNELLG